MKIGQKVNFYHPDYGERKDAVVEEITGIGASNAKELTLVFKHEGEELRVHEVCHGRDAAEGAAFWLLKGEKAPEGWAEAEPEEDVDLPEPELVEHDEDEPAPTRGRARKRRR